MQQRPAGSGALSLWNATGCLVSDERQRDHVPAIVPERASPDAWIGVPSLLLR
jgi:hypothetical protein